jgi:hypothetical protein
MFESRLSRLLMLLGAAVGVGSLVIWALEMRINFPDWLIRLAMVKLALAGSLGLLAAGALLGRHARTRALPQREPPALADATSDVATHQERDRVSVERRDELR